MKQRGKFSSKLAFIISSMGAAVGLGIIWMFPSRLCQYGGATFLIPYFLFVFLLGYPGLMLEFTFGRSSKSGTLLGIKNAFKEKNVKHGNIWGNILGAIPTIGVLGMFSFYSVILGWIIQYLFLSVSQNLTKINPTEYFSNFTGSVSSALVTIIAILVAALVVSLGINNGIEKLNKIAIPTMFILFVILIIRSVTLPGAIEGIKYMCIPRWEVLLNVETWIMAMGLAFFSVSLSGCVMVVYGSYTDSSTDIPKSALTIVFFNTVVGAMLASFAIIPSVFAFNIDLCSGPALLFVSLPSIFASMPFGSILSVLFFTCVFFAALTTSISMLEGPVEALLSITKLKRKKATLISLTLSLIIAIPLSLNMNLFSKFVDLITIVIAPLSVLIVAVVFFWRYKNNEPLDQINLGCKRPLGKSFIFIGKYIFIPFTFLIIILGIIYGGIG